MSKKYPYQLMEYIAHLLINTRFERLAFLLRKIKGFNTRRKYPELKRIYREGFFGQKVMKSLIHDSMNCIDVGAHLGSVLSQFLKYSPNGNHMAIEPVPYKAQWLQRKFPKVEVHQVAVSDTLRTATFYYYPHQSGYSGLVENKRQLKKIEFMVECKRLDDLVPLDKHIDFIKVDVEGYELNFFYGARKILKQYQPHIMFECTRSGLMSVDRQPHEIFNLLTQQYHYSIFLFDDWFFNKKPLDVEQFSNAMNYPFQAFNFLATTQQRSTI